MRVLDPSAKINVVVPGSVGIIHQELHGVILNGKGLSGMHVIDFAAGRHTSSKRCAGNPESYDKPQNESDV